MAHDTHDHDHDHDDHDDDHDHDHDHDHHDDDHDHGHDHAHGHHHHRGHHHHGPADFGDKRYLIGIGLNLAVVIAQAAGGLIGHSTALLADASHNMSDVLGLALAGGAAWLAAKPPGARRTYGFSKATVFAALINGLLLVFASGGIVWEAIRRFVEPQPVDGNLVMATAGLGVVVNGLTALMFMRGREGDANVRAAFLHMAGDALISVGVIVAGALVALTHVAWIDPLASILIVLVILWGTFGLLRDATDMAMDVAPRSVDLGKLEAFLAQQPGVTEVHDLHVWSMGAASLAMTAHLVAPGEGDHDPLLQSLCREVERRFDIDHATFQIERRRFDCLADHH